MQPVILWTDGFIFLMVATWIGYGAHVARHPHLAAQWRSVWSSPVAVSAWIFLLIYMAIGLLDSMHYRQRLPGAKPGQQIVYAPEVISVLDAWLAPLRKRVERTYSAPLAAYAYAKETTEDGEGAMTRQFPRLTYGGAHLSDPDAERSIDILRIALQSGAMGIAIILLLFYGIRKIALPKHAQDGQAIAKKTVAQQPVAWRAAFCTLSLLIIVSSMAIGFGRHYHVLGTDKIGQDVLYLCLKGIRTSIIIGFLTTGVMLPFAITLGLAAGYFGRWIDDVIQYIYTTLSAIPGVLLIAASMLTLQVYMDQRADHFPSAIEYADMRLLMLCLILGATGWIGLCRLLRGETLKLREMEYVQAAMACGAGHGRILIRHILPNVTHIVLIAAILDFSGLVLAEAVLSYVGIGVDPTMISWGQMINSARMEMVREPIVWWSLSSAFLFMFVLVLAANLFSDTVRDAFDPRLRGQWP